MTGYVGILPLVAATALLGRVRLRPRPPEWLVWHVMALAGIVLALGGNTPVGSLLVHLPLFDSQRLQSRNILIADLALAVLLGYWADQPFRAGSRRFLRRPAVRRGPDLETVLALLPPLAVLTVVTLGLCWGAGLLRWLRVTPGATSLDGLLKPGLVPYLLIAGGAIAFVLVGRHLGPVARSRWLAGFVLADLVIFTLLSVVAVLPGLGRRDSGTTAAAAASRTAPRTPPAEPIADLGYPGRFAIYDPDQLNGQDLSLLGAPDLNVITRTPSVQGYSSLVSGFYASATGSHRATGDGQDVLDPRAVRTGVLDQLDTSVLMTVPAYLTTRSGTAAARRAAASPGSPGTGHRGVAARHQTTWYFAEPLGVTRLEVPDADARQDAAQGTRIGLLIPGGTTRWFPAVAAGPARLAISLPHALTSVAVVAQAGGQRARLGPASVTDSDGRVFVADGQLQDALIPPRWGYAGRNGSFAVFVDHYASGPLRLQAIAGAGPGGVRAEGCRDRGRPDRGRRVLPAWRPGDPLGGGDGRVDRPLASPPRPGRPPGRAPGRPRPGRGRAGRTRRRDLELPAARVPHGFRAVPGGGRAHPARLGQRPVRVRFPPPARTGRSRPGSAPGRDGGQPGPGPLRPQPMIAASRSGVFRTRRGWTRITS